MTDKICNKKRKFDQVNIEEDYSNINLDNYKKYLFNKELKLKKELKHIHNLKKKTNILIAKKCEEENEKHDWIKEKEDCMYGSKFTYCKICRVDYYDKAYFH